MNIFNDFKKELGYRDVVNQYIELSQRLMQKELASKLTKSFSLQDYAKQYDLNICELHDELSVRISQNYIVNIHTALALFLERFISLPATPSLRKKDKILYNVLKMIYLDNIPQKVKILYYICDYYRLVRNNIIHSDEEEKSVAFKNAKAFLDNRKDDKYLVEIIGKLDALHEPEFLTFDDQVLFSKATIALAERIFYDTSYNLVNHAKTHLQELKQMTSRYKNNPNRIYSMLNKYFTRIYPINSGNYEEQLKEIVLMLKS